MTTSDWLTRMYAMPSEALKQQQQTLMRKLHTIPALPISGTTAQNGRSCNASAQTSRCYSDPYLHRVYWLLTNKQGDYLAAVCGTVLHWARSANAVPEEYRFCSHQRVKSLWLQIKDWAPLDDEGLSITPVNFYAYRNTPYIWCACDD